MDLIDRKNKVYGPPAKLVASDHEWDIKFTFGPSEKDTTTKFHVRGAPVARSRIFKHDKGGTFVLCQFLNDGRVMMVNENNIKERAIRSQQT